MEGAKMSVGLSGFMMTSALVMSMAMLSGCGPMYMTIPDRFATIEDAFPDEASMLVPEDKPDAYARYTFRASYAATWRAIITQAASAKFIINYQDEKHGLIKVQENLQYARRYSVIKVEESGSKRTEVVMMTKLQRSCTYHNPTSCLGPATLGTVFVIGNMQKSECEKTAQLQWIGTNSLIQSFLGDVQNALIKAGHI